MKKILFLIPVVLCLAVSCRKVQFVLSDDPFTIEVKNVYATSVLIDIIPENNDFYYYYDIVSVADFEKYDSDAEFIRYCDNMNRDIYDILVEADYADGPYEEVMLYRDATLEPYYGNGVLIEPETEYYLYAFAYDSGINPVGKLHKVRFKTPKEIHSTNTFTVTMDGPLVTVTPSNDDQYLFDFATEKELEESYYGSPEYYYNQMIEVYEQYGFIEEMVSTGTDSDNIFDYYESVEDGEKLYVMVAGYDHGLTTDVSIFTFTYKAK